MIAVADQAVVASTVVLLSAVRSQARLVFADDIWSPVSDPTVKIIGRRFGARLKECPLPEGVQEIGIPAYIGEPVILLNTEIAPAYRSLALRHGLAHLIAGELAAEGGADVRFMASSLDWMSLEERRADLFALADLIPDREIMDDPEWLAGEISLLAPDWPADRLFDRVNLRLALWRGR